MKKALLALAVLLGVAEGGARLLEPWLTAHTQAYYYRQFLSALTQPDADLIWTGVPNAHAWITGADGRKVEYRLNGAGWRDTDFAPMAFPGSAIAFGDSFTFGTGVEATERYTDLLGQMFLGLKTWNLGVMGYAPDHYAVLGYRWLPTFPWKLALVQLSNNDLADVAGHGWSGFVGADKIPLHLSPPAAYGLLSGASAAWDFLVTCAVIGNRAPGEAALREGLARLLLSLRELSLFARKRNVPLLVLQASDWGAPAYGEKIAGEYREGVVALAKEQGFGLLEAAQRELLPAPDLHWTAAAHRKVAQALYPEVHRILFPPELTRPSAKRSGGRPSVGRRIPH